MKHILICLAVLLCVTGVSAQTRRAKEAELKIGTVDNRNYAYRDGCGCSLASPSASKNSTSAIAFTELDNESSPSRAWLNIDGRVTTLKFVSSTQKSNQRLRKGSSYTKTYRSGDVTARITYVVTSIGEIESTNYTATIVVTKGKRSKTVKAIGECGC